MKIQIDAHLQWLAILFETATCTLEIEGAALVVS